MPRFAGRSLRRPAAYGVVNGAAVILVAGGRSEPRSRKNRVLGATGGTGQQVVSQALQQGHDVTVLVRTRQRFTITNNRLPVLSGNVTDDNQALADAVRDQDAVISTLGVGRSFKSGRLITQSMPRIVRAMEHQGIRRLIFTSAFGVGDTRSDVPLIPRIFMRLLLRTSTATKNLARLRSVPAALTGRLCTLSGWSMPRPANTAQANASRSADSHGLPVPTWPTFS